MDDTVLKGFVTAFAEERGLPDPSSPHVFEEFATSSILRKYHHSTIMDIDDDVLVGGSGDGGLDAVAILVNGRLARTKEDIKFFVDNHRRLDVEFVFIQAKSSNRFNAAEIGTFTFGVREFFSKVANREPNVSFTDEILELMELAHYIYFRHGMELQDNPKCFLYYVTTGKWNNNLDPEGRLIDGKESLEQLNLFSEVKASPVDSDTLKTICRELKGRVDREVVFGRKAAFPAIEGVDEAYIGLLPGDEYIKLVSTDDGELNRELFYDNVRDFQGHNAVNQEIGETLSREEFRDKFPLLNNGITIIARSIRATGDKLRLLDFQIVNGCQTSHILFQNKTIVDANTFIPIKIVATQDSSIVSEAIKATNRQTAVLPEALESLTPFHKELEELYNFMESGQIVSDRIYYERRSKQYTMDKIEQTRIVTLTGQIKSFIAMFLDEPHSHPRYYGELLRAYRGRIFADDHKPDPYYASGVSLLAVDKWMNASHRDREFRSYKHQILMLMRILIAGPSIPRLNSSMISQYARKIVEGIRSEQGYNRFSEAIELLQNSLSNFEKNRVRGRGQETGNPPHRLRAFTEQLKRAVYSRDKTVIVDEPKEAPVNIQEVSHGRIAFFNPLRRYGSIRTGQSEPILVEESELSGVPHHLRIEGTEVQFEIVENPRFPGAFVARNVKVPSKS